MTKLPTISAGKESKVPDIKGFTKKAFLCIIASILFQFSKAQFDCTGLQTTPVSYTGGVQTFTVPPGVTQVRISLIGASGGLASATANMAGGGATVYAYVNVVVGDVFRIIIGQKGTNGNRESGGGGASAVYKNGVLIMVAGGGGGEDNTGNGGNGLASVNGGNGNEPTGTGDVSCTSSPANGAGGTGGNGGNHGEFGASCPHGGGGGGGLNSPGQGNGNAGSGQPGGQGNINGVAGGIGSNDDEGVGINGGWGWAGGGGADQQESGGGGGYSGGGGGPESGYPGGGGSFVAAIGTNGITQSGKTDGTGTTTGANGSGLVCSSPAITLPVHLISFTATASTQGNLLKWQTADEINNRGFHIERSVNGTAWETIGFVAAATGNIYQYQFTDVNPLFGNNFYRLKQEDIDGKYEYSPIRSVQNQYAGRTSIFPNPADHFLSILTQENKFKAQIINSDGKILATFVNQKKLEIRSLPSGVYYLKLMYRDKVENLRFLKR